LLESVVDVGVEVIVDVEIFVSKIIDKILVSDVIEVSQLFDLDIIKVIHISHVVTLLRHFTGYSFN